MNTTRDPCSCKVGRGLEQFGLEGLNDDLIARRRGADRRSESLRDLADHFNRAVLERAIERAGTTPLDGEIENIYRLLTDEDVDTGMRVRVRKRLQGEGVPLDEVEDRFVSHPTMGSHLAGCLGVTQRGDERPRTEVSMERIFKMQSRSEAVIGNTLHGLESSGWLTIGELAVTVSARVMCAECGAQAEVGEFIDRGGCDCERSSEG